MKLEGVFLGFIMLSLFMFVFGMIEEVTNPVLQILLYGGLSWKELISIPSLFSSATTLIGAGTTVGGIVLKNRYWILAGLCGWIATYSIEVSPIINYFPNPLGYIVFGILNFMLIFSVISYWSGTG